MKKKKKKTVSTFYVKYIAWWITITIKNPFKYLEDYLPVEIGRIHILAQLQKDSCHKQSTLEHQLLNHLSCKRDLNIHNSSKVPITIVPRHNLTHLDHRSLACKILYNINCK